jgi:hypothetical protein
LKGNGNCKGKATAKQLQLQGYLAGPAAKSIVPPDAGPENAIATPRL